MKAIMHRIIVKEIPEKGMSKKESWAIWAIGGFLTGGLIRMAIYLIFSR